MIPKQERHLMRSIRLLFLVVLAGLVSLHNSCTAWIPTTPRTARVRLPMHAQTEQQQDETQELRNSIKAMKQLALERLDKLSHQMEELQEQQAAFHALDSTAEREHKQATKEATTRGTFFEEPREHRLEVTPLLEKQPPLSDQTTAAAAVTVPVVARPDLPDLLDDTWWKIGFDIRREPGTWMPKEWGQSGDKLRCQVVVDFTSQPCTHEQALDEFFHANADTNAVPATTTTGSSSHNAPKLLTVQEAWIFPTGVGEHQVGRRPLPVELHGAYKICMHQGPYNTHLVRFYLTVKEDVRPSPDSDLYLPAGRVYGSCGYFPQSPDHRHVTTEKDELAAEYHRLVQKDVELQQEMASETKLFSMDRVKRVRDQWALRREMDKVNKRLQEARQRDPDRNQLRLSRSGNVGLSREGGICCKVVKGMAMEYRILDRMEVANDEHHAHEPLDGAEESSSSLDGKGLHI